MKKLRRYIKFYLKVYFLKFVYFFLVKIKFYILPNFSKEYLSKVDFSKENNSFFFKKVNNKFDLLKIDTSNLKSDLCKLGAKYDTDKSPYSKNSWHRHPYTGIYDIFFSRLRNKKFNFAEIGIGIKIKGIKTFRKYFSKAKIYGFEFDQNNLKTGKRLKLKNTFFSRIDVRIPENIDAAFSKTKKKFEIIIDDSSHDIPDQINIIKRCAKYLASEGILVIEDIFVKKNIELEYINLIGKTYSKFEKIIFVDCNHINKYSKNWNNDKLCFLIKS